MAAFNSMIHRAINLPLSTEDFNKEMHLIKQIAINNGYSNNIIDHILNNKKKKQVFKSIYPQINNVNDKRIISLTY